MACRACLSCHSLTWHPTHARPRVHPDRPAPTSEPKPFLPGTRTELWRTRRARMWRRHRKELPEVPAMRRSIIMRPDPPPADAVVPLGEVLVSYRHGRIDRIDPAVLDELARRTLPKHARQLAAFYKRHPERWAALSERYGAAMEAEARERVAGVRRAEAARQAAEAREWKEWAEAETKRKAAAQPFNVLDVLPYLVTS